MRDDVDAAKALLEMSRANGRIEVAASNASAAELGITPRTLRRAASEMGLSRERAGDGDGFEWVFPDAVASDEAAALDPRADDSAEAEWLCEADDWGNEEWEWHRAPSTEAAS